MSYTYEIQINFNEKYTIENADDESDAHEQALMLAADDLDVAGIVTTTYKEDNED